MLATLLVRTANLKTRIEPKERKAEGARHGKWVVTNRGGATKQKLPLSIRTDKLRRRKKPLLFAVAKTRNEKEKRIPAVAELLRPMHNKHIRRRCLYTLHFSLQTSDFGHEAANKEQLFFVYFIISAFFFLVVLLPLNWPPARRKRAAAAPNHGISVISIIYGARFGEQPHLFAADVTEDSAWDARTKKRAEEAKKSKRVIKKRLKRSLILYAQFGTRCRRRKSAIEQQQRRLARPVRIENYIDADRHLRGGAELTCCF